MKQWRATESKIDLKSEENYIIKDLFKSEMLDTRITITNLMSESRNNKNSEIFKSSDSNYNNQKSKIIQHSGIS